jgi:FkbM family methyltransferase
MSRYLLKISDEEIARYRFMAEMAARSEADQWLAAGIVEGATVADVGCGPGAVSAALARVVGPSGQVYAVDSNPEALDHARRLLAEAGVGNVEVWEGGASDTGLTKRSVDVVMMRHVLAHNGGHEQEIVNHLASLLRPGGFVYLLDIDATAMRMWPPIEGSIFDEINKSYAQMHERLGNDLSVGLRLGELLDNAGLQDIEHRGKFDIFRPQPGMRPPNWAARDEMLQAGLIDQTDIERWQAEFERFDRGEVNVTLFLPLFSAWGRKAG